MPFSPVPWVSGDLLTSSRLTAMVRNIQSHDHRSGGTQGAPRMRIQTGWVYSWFPAAAAWTEVEVEYGTRNNQNYGEPWFDPNGPIPRVMLNCDAAGEIGGNIDSWRVTNESLTGFTAGIWCTTSAANPDFRFVAVQAIV